MKFIFSILFSISVFAGFAQKYTDKTIKQSCDCMTKVDINMEPKKLEEKVSKCVEDAILDNLSGLIKEYNLDLDDEAAAEKLGEKVAMKLVSKCPSFIEYVQKFPDEEDDSNKSDEYEFVEGKITNVNKSDVITLTIEEASGDIRVFYLIDYFIGAEKITTDLDSVKGKKVKIGYVSKKIFDKESNDFKERKIIIAFEYWN